MAYRTHILPRAWRATLSAPRPRNWFERTRAGRIMEQAITASAMLLVGLVLGFWIGGGQLP